MHDRNLKKVTEIPPNYTGISQLSTFSKGNLFGPKMMLTIMQCHKFISLYICPWHPFTIKIQDKIQVFLFTFFCLKCLFILFTCAFRGSNYKPSAPSPGPCLMDMSTPCGRISLTLFTQPRQTVLDNSDICVHIHSHNYILTKDNYLRYRQYYLLLRSNFW